jgi:acetyl esterase/lipase
MLPIAGFLAAPSRYSLFSTLVGEGGLAVHLGIAYGPEARHRLDVYAPREASGRAVGGAGRSVASEANPVALFLYGGAWRRGCRSCYGFVGAALAAHGIATAVADYRLVPAVRWPAFQEDAALAFAWTRRVLGENGRRPVAVVGHSAGAHIAALLAADRRWLGRDLPDALVGISGPYDFEPTHWPTTRDIFSTAGAINEPRPVAHVAPHVPPALLIHGSADRVVEPENTHALERAWQAAGRPVERLILDGADHRATVAAFARPYRRRVPLLPVVVAFLHGLADVKSPVRAAERG